MAIMWDPPAERPSLEPTPAEVAWKQWLMQALIDKADGLSSPKEHGERPAGNQPGEQLPPAA